MSNLQIGANQGNNRSLLQRLDDQKLNDSKDRNRFFSPSYAIENFVNVVSDNAGVGDTFKVLDDPTYSGFKLFFHFDATSGLLAGEENVDSALAYLKRIGYDAKYNLLRRFINVLSKVNSITPWIFQDVEGLAELWSEPWEEIYKERLLNVLCLETLDNKIGSLAQMYKTIAYDHENRKWLLPKNLRQFSMSIFVYDYRAFSDIDATSVDFLQTIENTDVSKLNHTLFDLGYCQFDAGTGSLYFDQVSNNRAEANLNNLSIKYEQFEISGLFNSLLGNQEIGSKALATLSATSVNGSVPDDSFLTNRGILKSTGVDIVRRKIQDALDIDKWKTKLDYQLANTAAELIQIARGNISKLYLGNVYGFELTDIVNIGQNSISQTLQQLTPIQSLKTPGSIQKDDLGNVND